MIELLNRLLIEGLAYLKVEFLLFMILWMYLPIIFWSGMGWWAFVSGWKQIYQSRMYPVPYEVKPPKEMDGEEDKGVERPKIAKIKLKDGKELCTWNSVYDCYLFLVLTGSLFRQSFWIIFWWVT